MDAIAAFARHVAERRFEDFPADAVAAAKTLVLDTCGVGMAGSSGPMAAELAATQDRWGRGDEARVWSTGKRLPAPAAAFCNAYQIHNSEFDCVHEQAVAHVMTIVLPVALAVAERQGRAGVPVTGRQLIEAVVLGVDVAASLGVAATSGLRFFRPATVGAFGGAAVLGKLLGFDATRLHDAFSIVYGQLCGTMQAHTEGSLLLAMQMGFNARNAIVAGDLAAAGVAGPRNILEGDFGYYKLIETAGDPGRAAAELGRIWRITEVAQKPFPSGRATHGLIDGCLDLQRRHDFGPNQISRVTAHVPPLVHQLVGRPCKPDMSINYARLCASYVAACALLRGTVGIEDFCDTAYRDPATQALAARIEVKVAAGDPNALTPVAVEIELQGGACHAITLDVVTGHPRRPMTRTAHLAKFETNCAHAAVPLPPEKVQHLIALVDTLEAVADAATLVDAMIA